tara:strand:+ start:146 stop:475 length:330 start_codon:yes stop_codon:yes gene_type:complete
MNKEKRIQLKQTIDREIKKTILSVEEYKQLTKPIKPENSIGRVSRMDAINNKSVIEAALRKLEEKLEKLKFIKTQVYNNDFGICVKCNQEIPIGRMLIVPESRFCVNCA